MRTFLVLLLACLLGSGCSAIRTVYNQAEHVALWSADDYFDLTQEQKSAFRSAFARIHAWHRATQLQTYAGFLEVVEQRVRKGPAPDDIDWAYGKVNDYSDALVQRGYRDAAQLLATLSDAQVATASKRFEQANRKFAREHGVGRSSAEQRRLRAKQDRESLEHWSGPLDPAQQAQVIALSEALPLDAALREEDRVRRQREFLQLLAQRHDPRFAERLRDWLLDWNAQRTPELQARFQADRTARSRMWIAVFELLRPDQQRKIVERLQWYSGIMRDLAREAQQADARALPQDARL